MPVHPKARPTATPRLGIDRFQLAPLQKFEPSRIVAASGKDELGAFLLALALAFNDLKDFIVLRQALIPTRPGNVEVSEHAGQWQGLVRHLERLMIGAMHELLQLFDSYKEVASGPEIATYLKTASPQVRRYWNTLVGTATKNIGGSDQKFAEAIVKIRNNIAFHYYQPRKLVEGYRTFFADRTAPHRAWAYGSLGRNMEETRFYYADAAATQATELLMGDLGSARFSNRLNRQIEFANNAIEHVLRKHLEATADSG